MFSKFISRSGWVLSGALALVLVASLAESTLGGPLDPPGSVAPTSLTLQAWDRQLSGTDGTVCQSSRFKCVLTSNAAVLDRETGLVWARNASLFLENIWSPDFCGGITIGGRAGWRLPTLEELMSLYDLTNVNPDPSLPDGFPFTNAVDTDGYWTGTTYANSPNMAYYVDFVGESDGAPGTGPAAALKSSSTPYRIWCVRGGQGNDGF